MKVIGIGLGIALLLSRVAIADLANPHLLPFGEREALSGNAGVAGGPSSGCVHYNPAGLTLIEHGRLSVSGSTYVLKKLSATPFVRVDGTNLDYAASGFDAIPSAVSSILRWGESSVGFSVLVPESSRLENRLTLPTTNTLTTLDNVQSANDLWIGGSLARKVGPDWAMGVSLFLAQSSASNNITVTSRNPATPTLADVTHTNLRVSVSNLVAVLGVLWNVSPDWRFGLRLRTPSVRVSGTGDSYAYEQTVSGSTQTIAERDLKDLKVLSPLPFDGSLGLGWVVTPTVRVLFDASLQAGVTYDPFPGSALSTSRSVELRARYNLGAELDLSPNVTWSLGALFNPSALPSTVAAGVVRQNFWGVTTGLAWQADRVRTGAGLFYLWAKDDFVPIGATIGTRRTTAIGATLFFGYNLGEVAPAPVPPPAEPT